MFALFFNKKFAKSICVSLITLSCVLGVSFLQLPQLKKFSSTATSPETVKREMQLEKLRLDLLQQVPTFGFKNLIADWVFIDFLQYFGDDEAREKTGYSLSPEYFEVILAQDPYFLQAYLFLSTSTSLYAAMPERAVALMAQGLKSLSPSIPEKSYYVWRYKGIDELLFLGDAKAAQQSFATAAQWANTYVDAESKQVAAISQRTAKFLARNPKSKTAQITAWTMVLNNRTDEQTRNLAIRRIQALGGKVYINSQGVLEVQPPKEN